MSNVPIEVQARRWLANKKIERYFESDSIMTNLIQVSLDFLLRFGNVEEVTVRGALGDGARIWMFPGRVTAATPTTRAAAEQRARTSTLFATAEPHPPGATATPAGHDP